MEGLPSDLDAERGLLSCALQDTEIRRSILGSTEAGIFYHPAHQALFRAVVEMHEAGKAIDFITLSSRLGEKGLDELGGKEGLDYIWNFIPAASAWAYYKDILLDVSYRRRAILAAKQIDVLGRDSRDHSARSRIEAIAFELSAHETTNTGGLVFASVLASRFAEWIEDLNSGEVVDRGMPWACDGLPELIDKLRPGELCLIGGRPGSGKTSLLNSQVALAVLPNQLKAVVFSLEMTRLEETMRLVSISGGLPLYSLKNRGAMSPENITSYTASLRSLNNSQLAISDEILDIYQIYEKAAAYRKDKGQLDLIGIDYAQLIKVRNSEDRRLGLDEVGRVCKYMAKELDSHVMLLTSINRNDGLPFDCTSLEYHCDMFIEAKKSEPGEVYKEFMVRKNRNGPIGQCQVSWYEDCACLYSRE